MARRRRNKIGFWLFVLLLALGAGWAGNQAWRWPLLALFAPDGGQGGLQQEAPAVVVALAEPQAVVPPEAPDIVAQPLGDRHAEAQRTEAAVPPALEPRPEQSAAASGPAATTSASPGPASPTVMPGNASDAVVAADLPGDAAPLGTAAPAADSDSVAQPAGAPLDEVQPAAKEVAGPAALEPEARTSRKAAQAPAASQPQRDGQEQAQARDDGPPDGSTGNPSRTEPRPAAVIGDRAGAGAGAEPETARASADQLAGSGSEPAASQPQRDGQEPVQARDDGRPAGGAGGDAPAQEVAALLSEAKGGVRPSFDIVRVELDGRAVIAGRAEPGAEVEVRSGEQVIDRVRANRRGEWVAIPGKPLNPGDQQLTVVAALEGASALESEQMVVIAVPARVAPVPNQTSAAAVQPVAVLLPRSGRGTGRILQAPGRLGAGGTLALMTVGYDQKGQMLLSGEAPPGVPVRVYVDNRPVALVVGDAKGAWSSGFDQALAPGTYTLRLDQLDAKGQTVARIETPITRVSEPPIEGELQVDYVVVQPGNSLWRIARRLSGKGLDYVYIYDSNHAQIRDPDLIFPGQVFEIPAEVSTAG